jgi:hypothetical protein
MALKTASSMLSLWWKVQAAAVATPHPAHGKMRCLWWLPRRQQVWHNLVKAVLVGISITLDYWNMLVAMTFNVGLFVAVVMGYVLGMTLFSHVPDNFAAHLATHPHPQHQHRSTAYTVQGDPESGLCEGKPQQDGNGCLGGTAASKEGQAAGVPIGANGAGTLSEDICVMPSCCPEPR